MQQLTFDPEPLKPAGKLIFRISIPGRLPSWNAVLGMEQWQRYQFKKELARVFLSELRRCEPASSTMTTFAKNSTLTYAATLESFLETARQQRALKAAAKKLNPARLKKSSSKSLKKAKVPF